MDTKKNLQLDVPVSALLRKITKNMNNFPTALLYSSKSDRKGLGFTRLSTRITQHKERRMHSALEDNPATARAMKSILQRALVVNNCVNAPWQSATISGIHKEGWLSSLVQTLAETGKHLTLGGTAMANTVEQLLFDNNNLVRCSMMLRKKRS